MSKSTKARKAASAAMEKVRHGKWYRTEIPAGMASAGPPLGPLLGSRGVNVQQFCKEFNERTKDMKEGVPLPCKIAFNPDRTFDLLINQPPTSFFIKQAAGITRGAFSAGRETAGKITLKHVYEIAKIKSQDPPLQLFSLEEICRSVIGTARSCGVKVVRDLDSEEYRAFLQNRAQEVEDKLKQLKEQRETKVLRT